MTQDNIVFEGIFEESKLGSCEQEIILEISESVGFHPNYVIARSQYWSKDSPVGAFRCLGKYKDDVVELKIQGTRQNTSEAFMLRQFAQTSTSKILRPPRLYWHQPWDENKRYEAFITEHVKGDHIISLPTNLDEINNFYAKYQDYRENCLSRPWLDKPSSSISKKIQDNFERWIKISRNFFANHLLRHHDDEKLIKKAIEILIREYRGVEAEFQHGHFSHKDLIRTDNDEVVVFSNLYWSWRPPFYDAIFAYHWFMFNLVDAANLSDNDIDSQRKLWLDKIYNLSEVQEHLLNLALLERAAAGLNLDVLSIDQNKEIAAYIVESTRNELVKLLWYFGANVI